MELRVLFPSRRVYQPAAPAREEIAIARASLAGAAGWYGTPQAAGLLLRLAV